MVGEKITIGIDRTVVFIVVVNWIIAPGRIPVPRIPVVIPGSDENDGREVPIPPIPIVSCMLVSLQRRRVADFVGVLDLCGGGLRPIIRRMAIN